MNSESAPLKKWTPAMKLKRNICRASIGAASVTLMAATLSGCMTQQAVVSQPASPITAATQTPTAAVGVTQHDNTLTIYRGNGVTSMTLSNIGQVHVSAGQPYGGITQKTTKDGLVITVKAGRHDTSPVATWFNGNLTTDATSNTTGYNDHSESIIRHPADLNFAFTATLTINGTAYPVVIAQGDGSFLGGNPWYIGGMNWSNAPFESWYTYGAAFTPAVPGAAPTQYVVEQDGIIHHNYFKVETA